MQSFYMPPGYRIELVASEPLIQEPVALDWDVDGRLWAVEMPGFMADLTGSNEHEPIGRVVVLEDTDRDGEVGAHHLAYGSRAPLHDVMPSALRLRTAALDEGEWQQVAGGTAAAWLGEQA